MRFILAGIGNWVPAWDVARIAVIEAEKLGYWGVVLPDQYMWDAKDLGVETDEGVNSTLDAWIALADLAARTERINLGTWVTPIPFRPPSMLAKIVSSLDVMSNGRTILGVGAGSYDRNFEAYSEWNDKKTRVDKTVEGLDLMIQLWTKDRVNFEGQYYHAKDAILEPKPIQKPYPPLLFGGSGERMLRLAGRYASICYIPPGGASYEESRDLVLKEASRQGREDKLSFAASFAPEFPYKYGSKQFATKVEEAHGKGCGVFIVPFLFEETAPWLIDESSAQSQIEYYLGCLSDFARNIIPSFE